MLGKNKAKELFEQGRQFLDAQKYDDAIDCFSTSIEISENLAKAPSLYFRGLAYLEKVEYDTDEEMNEWGVKKYLFLAVKDIEDSIRLTKTFAPNQSKDISGGYLALSRAHFFLQSPQDIIEDAGNALIYDGQNIEAYLTRGYAYLEIIGNPSSAIDDFTKAIKIQPSSKAIFIGLGLI